jgi:hypothetical protein
LADVDSSSVVVDQQAALMRTIEDAVAARSRSFLVLAAVLELLDKLTRTNDYASMRWRDADATCSIPDQCAGLH